MAATDAAFRGLPKHSSCFMIWRVEKMILVPLPRDQYGKFYRGDSYIVLSVTESGKTGGLDIKEHEISGPLEMHVHFWLGSETSQDEAAVAAYKTVELDDLLGGEPVQHREVEGSETKRFRSYFKSGIRHLEGGVATGFKHVTDEFAPALYLVKGRRNPVIRQMSSVSWEYFNDGDVFVTDAKKAIFVWTGKDANRMEKIQGAKLAQSLKSEHGGADIVFVESGSENDLPLNERQLFDHLLPLKDRAVASSENDEADQKQEKRVAEDIKLYKCSDEDGALKVIEMKNGPLLQADLDTNDSFIVDNGAHGIWVWVGRKATPKERAEAMRNAQGFIKKKGYGANTPVTRVIEYGEPPEFKSLFNSWQEKYATGDLNRRMSLSKVAPTVQTSFDASTLHENPKLAAQTQMVDNGQGAKEIWRVETFDLKPVEQHDYGRFYSGDCYVILYTYKSGGAEHQILYYWLGAKSAQDERGTAALKTVEKDDQLGGRPVQVRVVQGKEPPHFMAMFGGRMVIYSGGVASSFDRTNGDHDPTKSSAPCLLHVRGTSPQTTKAVQVECRAGLLNSNDCFVLKSHQQAYVWCGKGATGDEREMAKTLAVEICQDPVVVHEGQEKEEFWSILGGVEPYANDKRLASDSTSHPTRLYLCSNASGSFKVEQLYDFDQSDLSSDDIMLLDAWSSVFIWVGVNSNRTERSLAEKTAMEYLRTDPAGRGTDTPILRINQDREPPTFTGFFGVWDPGHWNAEISWDAFKESVAKNNKGVVKIANTQPGAPLPVYPMKTLLVREISLLPGDVDPSRKEEYLSAEEFQQVFGSSREQYLAMPVWKRQQLKKNVGLF